MYQSIPTQHKHLLTLLLTTNCLTDHCYLPADVLGKEIQYPGAAEIHYALRDRAYRECIDQAHAYASSFLLDLLRGEYRLVERLG